jgi:hypothetical protein
MTIAEIHGKISEEGSNLSELMEDLLTADVFGCFRYLPPQKTLIPFLNTAKSFHGHALVLPDEIVGVHYSFWPWVKLHGCTPCEPDVVVGLETEGRHLHLVFIEAKYRSGLSSEEDEGESPNDQLARELDNLDKISLVNLHWSPELTVMSRALLFVTQDMSMPRNLIAQSLAEYQRKRNRQGDIYWTSWRFLQPVLEDSLGREDSPQGMAVVEDMLKLLLRKGLTVFRGVDRILSCLDLPRFYVIPPKIYTWPSSPEYVDISYKYEVKTNG